MIIKLYAFREIIRSPPDSKRKSIEIEGLAETLNYTPEYERTAKSWA